MITETRFVYFRHILGKDGIVSAETFFKIRSNAKNAADAANDAKNWAGEIGSPLKIGGTGQNVFQFHPDFAVSEVEIKENSNEFVFDVRIAGTAKNETWQILPESEYTEKDGCVTKKIKYIFNGENPPDFPHEGDIINDSESGRRLVCTTSSVCEIGKNCKKLSLTFRNLSELPSEPETNTGVFSKIKYEYNDNSMRCIAEIYCSKETFNSQIATLQFFDENNPPVWAGENFVLEKMESAPDGSFGYVVKLTALKIETKLVSVNTCENANYSTVEAVYETGRKNCDSFENLIGSVPVFADGDFIITSVEKKEINPALFHITIKAEECRNMTRIGEIVSIANSDGTVSKKAGYFIKKNDAESFRSSLQISAAADWAGNDFYLHDFTEKETANGFIFELEAAEIKTRMLSMSQEERFAGFDIAGLPRREVIYQSTWQVLADDFKNFVNISGQNASWTSDNAVITEINPEKISGIEYRIVMKAQKRSNPDLYKIYTVGDYENLSNKVEFSCELVDFRLSPKDCGYFINGDGMHEILAGWQPENECPFAGKSVLHPKFINRILKILRISEITYAKGNMTRSIPDMTDWINTRIFNGKIGNHQGSYLKNDLYAKEICDNNGDIWTKITRVYDLAPQDTEWNQYYFNKIR